MSLAPGEMLEIPLKTVLSDRSDASFGAIFRAAAVARLPEAGLIRVTGDDRVRWLNGMVTNSIGTLTPGQGCFNFLLNAQGRIQGTAYAFAEAGSLLLETDRAQVEPMLALLDRFIIMDDVELTDLSAERAGLLLAGPAAERSLRAAGLLAAELAELRAIESEWRGQRVRVQRMPGPVIPMYELWSSAAVISELREELLHAGAVEADEQSLEWLRMLEGRPRFGVDIRERELPQETAQTEALHFSKGCYLGQEIVERIRSRGSVHRVFGGFALEGELALPGAALTLKEKPVGELTSIARLPAFPGFPDGLSLALGYARREALEAGEPLRYAAGGGYGMARPVRVPIRPEALAGAYPTTALERIQSTSLERIQST